jgi:tetratricopeptide (TPR) repeat protein
VFSNHKTRAAAAKQRGSVRKYLRSHIEKRTFGELIVIGKGVAVTLLTVIPTVLAIIVVTNAIHDNGVVMTYLRVPQSFEAIGFSSETATQQLLDEISALNSKSVAVKPKTRVGDTRILEALSSVETPAGSLDLKSVQSLIQRVLGKNLIQISGEITTRKEDNRELTRLRLRQTPGREVLIDVETSQGPQDLFRKAALNLLEHIDPEIAAGIYWREYRDEENAWRLTAIALGGGHPDAEKYALNLRSLILASRGQADEALKASDQARAIDPKFAAAEYSRAVALFAGGRKEEALAAAKLGVERAANSDNSYNTLGFILSGLGRNEDAIVAFKEAVRLNRLSFIPYRRLAYIYGVLGRPKEASEVIFSGIALMPQSALLQFDYAEDLRKNGKPHEAIGPMRKAYELQPDNLNFIIGLAEVELSEGHETEALRLASMVKSRLRSGEKVGPNFKSRSDALIALLEAKPSRE